MATLVLSAAGAALGGAAGGSVLGLSAATLGRAAGAMLGRALDERLLGQGSAPVEVGRLDRFRLTGASEGAAIPRLHGAVRAAGQVIWTSRFREHATESGGGKGAPSPRATAYTYTVSLALALCEGEVTGLGRVWADGEEVARDSLTLRLHRGTEDQLPDALIEAEMGAGRAPAFRGTAYVVVEDLDLDRFGNRVPQLSFEVIRTPRVGEADDLASLVRAVALIPGSGEYALATTPVHLAHGWADARPANVATPQGKADLLVSLDQLDAELPRVGAVSLVVSWFGSDLRLGSCPLRPKVEQRGADGEGMPWVVSGLSRAAAEEVPRQGGRPLYGGTPADASVVEAIRELRRRGKAVTFYPFLLMDQLAGNALPDPRGGVGQPALPWRGRITLSVAPGRAGSPDGTAAAEAEVAAFFGAARPSDFTRGASAVAYHGPPEWSLRRMTLHYAHLCALAGGVDAFVIASELPGVTTIRGAGGGYPAVEALRDLARDVKAILPAAKLTYAADWTEWSGHQPEGEGATKRFHLDPLWADPAIAAVGIDNYMPLSDWRDGDAHADARHGSVHDDAYLAGNVAGGELHDWFYATEADRQAQVRTPVTDGHGEPWVWRLKDLRGWWSHPHHDRVAGVRSPAPTAWVPRSKPIWFTELGCAAIDKGPNEPNKFLDPKSSESAAPRFSSGEPDDRAQVSFLKAHARHWSDGDANPVSPLYGGRMVDLSRAFVWAWDARPFPHFPADAERWSDGDNHRTGHWLNGRAAARSLAAVIQETCRDAGLAEVDVSAVHGLVRGMLLDDAGTARAALQPLLLAHGLDAVEREGRLVFLPRTSRPAATVAEGALVQEDGPALALTRAPEAELAGRVQLSFLEHGADYDPAAAAARLADDPLPAVARTDLPLVLSREEAEATATRWLHEARAARDAARFALPPSLAHLGPGDVLEVAGGLWRIDRAEDRGARAVEATRVEPSPRPPARAPRRRPRPVAALAPVEAIFLDLPLLRGDEAPHAPHVAFASAAWPGPVTLLSSPADSAYVPVLTAPRPATAGTTLTPLARAPSGRWDRGPALRVRLASGALASAEEAAVLAGANAAALGDGEAWEVIQFARATLVAPLTYDLSLRLRGQAGTDGVAPPSWPAGSRFVLLDGAVRQWDLPPSAREGSRRYRWGPASRPPHDPSWRGREAAFAGVGLRPYAPCALRAREEAGALRLAWTRRARLDGDSWTPPEPPVGEAREAYLVRVLRGPAALREAEVAAPAWTYAAPERAADGPGPLTLAVAQLSDRWGPGPFATLEVP